MPLKSSIFATSLEFASNHPNLLNVRVVGCKFRGSNSIIFVSPAILKGRIVPFWKVYIAQERRQEVTKAVRGPGSSVG